MKKLLIVFLAISATACQSKKQQLQPIADVVKKHFLAELGDVEKIDTIYLQVDTLTAKSLKMLQSYQFKYDAIDLKIDPSTDFEYNEKYPIIDTTGGEAVIKMIKDRERKADSCRAIAANLDSVNILYYEVRPMVLFTQKNMIRKTAESRLYLDKNLNMVSQKSVLDYVSKNYATTAIKFSDYKQLPDEVYKNDMEKMGVYRFY